MNLQRALSEDPICSSDLADKMKVKFGILSNLLDELSQNQTQLIDTAAKNYLLVLSCLSISKTFLNQDAFT